MYLIEISRENLIFYYPFIKFGGSHLRNNIHNTRILIVFLLLTILLCNSQITAALYEDISENNEPEYWGVFVYVDVCIEDPYSDHL